MSPSTSPDSTVNPGGSASAPAGMVSGEGGRVQHGRAATRPTSGVGTWTEFKFRSIAIIWKGVVTHCKGLETHGQQRHHGSVFYQVPVLQFCQEATPVAAQEPGKLEAVDRVATQLPRLECRQGF